MVVSLFSCEEDKTKNPLPVRVEGQFVKLEINSRYMLLPEIETTSFGGLLTDTSGKIVKYDLYVRRTGADGYVLNDYVLFKTITSFPHNLSITPSQLATALSMNVSDFKEGDLFRFKAYSYDANGVKAGYDNLTRILQTTDALNQGYKFNTSLLNAPDPSYDNRSESF